jgi:hypothetical protein
MCITPIHPAPITNGSKWGRPRLARATTILPFGLHRDDGTSSLFFSSLLRHVLHMPNHTSAGLKDMEYCAFRITGHAFEVRLLGANGGGPGIVAACEPTNCLGQNWAERSRSRVCNVQVCNPIRFQLNTESPPVSALQ